MWNGNPIPCNPCQRLISDWISEQAAARSGPVALTCFFGHVQMVNLEQLWLWLLFLSLGIFALIFSMFHLFFLSHFKQNTITRVFRMNIPIHCLCDHIYLRERSDDAPLVVSRLLAGRMGREESREHRMDTSWWVDNTRRICQGKDRIGRQRQEGKEQGKQEGKCVSCVKRCSTLFNQDESCGHLQTPTYGSCGFWICVFAGVCTGLLYIPLGDVFWFWGCRHPPIWSKIFDYGAKLNGQSRRGHSDLSSMDSWTTKMLQLHFIIFKQHVLTFRPLSKANESHILSDEHKLIISVFFIWAFFFNSMKHQ